MADNIENHYHQRPQRSDSPATGWVIGAIVASWAISPVMGGIIAAILLGFIKWTIIYREDRIAASL